MKKLLYVISAIILLTNFALAQTLSPSSGGAPTGAAGGKLSGTYPNPGLNAACADLSNGGTACSQNYTATTWTPTLITTGTIGTPAYNIQVGSYEQIGRLVIAHFAINLTGWTGTPTGNVEISLVGLPAPNSTVNDYGTCFVGSYAIVGSAAAWGVTGYIAPATTVVVLLLNAQTGASGISTVVAGTTPQFIGTCIYHT